MKYNNSASGIMANLSFRYRGRMIEAEILYCIYIHDFICEVRKSGEIQDRKCRACVPAALKMVLMKATEETPSPDERGATLSGASEMENKKQQIPLLFGK